MSRAATQDWLLETWSATPEKIAGGEGDPKLEVSVIFTTEEGALAALKAAGRLATDLNARISIIEVQAVPLAFPLNSPPVSIAFSLARLQRLARREAQVESETCIRLYLCRDKRKALLAAVGPKSLVVIGDKVSWWPCETKRITKLLSRHGNRVIFAEEE